MRREGIYIALGACAIMVAAKITIKPIIPRSTQLARFIYDDTIPIM